jgi:hypothetical protein
MFPKGNKLGRQFQKGQSGNPGGRPKKIIEVAKAARERTLEAIETLTSVMRNTKAPSAARVSAAIAILERGWGKAPQTVNLRRDVDFRTLSDDELLAIAAGATADREGGEPDGCADLSAAPGDKSTLN